MNAAHNLKPGAPLVLTDPIDTPWLAIRAADDPIINALVLVEPVAGIWRRIEDGFVESGRISFDRLTPLADFGMAVTLYPKTGVLSLLRVGPSRRGAREWKGAKGESIRFPRTLRQKLEAAVRECNAETLGKPVMGAAHA